MSSMHSFNTAVAGDVGVNAAVIFHYFRIWIKESESKGINFKDGCYWIKIAVSSLGNRFSYLSNKQIRTAIDVLVSKKYLKKAQLSDNKFDRITWYSFGAMSEIKEWA